MSAAAVEYPLKVDYCGNCGLPYEYCSFYPDYDSCKKYLQENLPEKFAALGLDLAASTTASEDEKEKKRQTRGGKGMVKAKKKAAADASKAEKAVLLSIAPRGKKKSVTVVQGLASFGIDLKTASKFFGQKFACGASITADDEIVIQGDFKDELFDMIPEKWPEVDEDSIEDLGQKKR